MFQAALNKKDLEQKRAIFFKAKHLLELHYEVQFFMKKADQGLDMSQKQEAMEKDRKQNCNNTCQTNT